MTLNAPTVLFYAIAAVVGFLAIPAAYDLWADITADRREPVIWHTAYSDPPKARPGDTIVITYEGERVRHCEARIVDFWVTPPGRRIQTWGPVPGGYTDIGTFAVKVEVEVPHDAQPGINVYRSRISHDCPDGVHNAVNPPDVIVEVLE